MDIKKIYIYTCHLEDFARLVTSTILSLELGLLAHGSVGIISLALDFFSILSLALGLFALDSVTIFSLTLDSVAILSLALGLLALDSAAILSVALGWVRMLSLTLDSVAILFLALFFFNTFSGTTIYQKKLTQSCSKIR